MDMPLNKITFKVR